MKLTTIGGSLVLIGWVMIATAIAIKFGLIGGLISFGFLLFMFGFLVLIGS